MPRGKNRAAMAATTTMTTAKVEDDAGGPQADADMAQALTIRIGELEQALRKADADMAAKVKHYEGKLMTMSVINGALQGENDKLKEAAASMHDQAELKQELEELQEEFTKRLGIAERTASTMRDECLGLRSQVEDLRKREAETLQRIQEKEAIATNCGAENERLHKKVMDLDSAVRRLKADVMKAEQDREMMAARLQAMEAAAKSEEINRSVSLEEMSEALEAAQRSLVEQKELYTKALAKSHADAAEEVERVREEVARQISVMERAHAERENAFAVNLESFRQSLAMVNHESSLREEELRQEIKQVEKKMREAVLSQEEAAGNLAERNLPLIRQIEGLSMQLAKKDLALETLQMEWMSRVKEEEMKTNQAIAAQQKAEACLSAAERKLAMADKAVAEGKSEVLLFQGKLREEEKQSKSLKEQCERAQEEVESSVRGREQAEVQLESALKAKEDAEREVERLRLESEALLERERKNWETERAALLLESANNKEASTITSSGSIRSRMRWMSFDDRDINGSVLIPPEDDMPTRGGGGGGVGFKKTVFFSSSSSSSSSLSSTVMKELDSLGKHLTAGGGGASAAGMELLTSKIRQLQGEMAQQQRELKAARASRDHVSEELLQVRQRLHEMEKDASSAPRLKAELEELKKRHEMALVIIGERNEKAEELEADMADVKALYREQVSLLVSQIDPEKWPNGYRICLFCPHCAQVQSQSRRSRRDKQQYQQYQQQQRS